MSIHSEEVIIHAISHIIRREILGILMVEHKSFSELLSHFDISTGKLNYHLTHIKGFIKKDLENKYCLTSLGLKANEILANIREKANYKDQPLLKEAFISQKNITKPLIVYGIYLGIGALGLTTFITGFLFVLFLIIPDQPIIIWPIISFTLIGEVLTLIWLLRIRKSAPAFLERLDKHLKETD